MRLNIENEKLTGKFKICVSLWYFVSGCEMSCYQPIFPGMSNIYYSQIKSHK